MPTVKPYGPDDAKIMLVGEGPTRNDALAGQIYSGNSGRELTKMLHEAGILQSECFITSVCRENISGWDSKKYFIKFTKKYQVPKPQVEEGIELLKEEVSRVKPNLIIALGELPLWALTGETGITKWRGSILEALPDFASTKLIPTYAPEVVQRKYDWRFIAVQDFRRCEKEALFPEIRMPGYEFVVRPSFQETMERLDKLLETANALRADN